MSNHEREGSQATPGDTALDRAWQQLSDERPPPALDAAITVAAHKSVEGRSEQAQVTRAGPTSRSWLQQWQPLAAAAAVAGLAFVLVQTLPRDRDVAPSLRMEEPATTPAAAGKQEPEQEKEQPSLAATRESIEAKTASPPASAVVPESVTAPAVAIDKQSAADAATTVRATEADQRQLATPDMAGRAASAAPAAPVPERRAAAPAATATAEAPARDNAAPPDSANPAARVAELYAAGDVAGAAAALREFRVVDPDADTYLPESLRDWARTVP